MHRDGDRSAWLKGGTAICINPGPLPDRPWHIVILGPPGVGKGTQADKLVDTYCACHLSTGDVFRAARGICDGHSRSMEVAIRAMSRGELVSDETVVAIVRERVRCLHCLHGFLLDGFPRTLEQAQTLDHMLEEVGTRLDGVIMLTASEETIVSRLSGRRVCRECKESWHVDHKPSKRAGICDHCGGVLFQRDDDQPVAIRRRLDAYRKTVSPLAEHYREAGILREVGASGSPDEVFSLVREQLEDLDQRTALAAAG